MRLWLVGMEVTLAWEERSRGMAVGAGSFGADEDDPTELRAAEAERREVGRGVWKPAEGLAMVVRVRCEGFGIAREGRGMVSCVSGT